MAVIGNLVIGMSVNQSRFKQGMQQSASVVARFQSAASKMPALVFNIGDAFRAAAALAQGFAGALSSVAMAAAEEGEAADLVRVQFGGAADTVIAKADEMADRFGVVRAEFLQGTGTLAGLLGQLGKGEQATAGLANQFGQLAADMSSAFNISFDEALTKLRSGLAGETEPLRAYGVLLSAADVKRAAYQSGIAELGAELTEQQKIQARVNLIMEQTDKIQGNLEQTMGSVANQVRAAGGRFENLKSDVGSAVEVVSQSLLAGVGEALTTVTGQVGDVRGAMKTWAGNAVQSGGVINDAVGGVGEAIALTLDVVHRLRAGFKRVQSVVTAVMAGAASAIAPVARLLDTILERLTGTNTVIGETATAIADDLNALAKQQERQADAMAEQGSGAEKVRDTFARIQQKMDEIGKKAKENATATRETAEQAEREAAARAAAAAPVKPAAPLDHQTATPAEAVTKAIEGFDLAGAITQGSQAARDILAARLGRGGTEANDQARVQRQQLAVDQQALRELQQMKRALLDPALEAVGLT